MEAHRARDCPKGRLGAFSYALAVSRGAAKRGNEVSGAKQLPAEQSAEEPQVLVVPDEIVCSTLALPCPASRRRRPAKGQHLLLNLWRQMRSPQACRCLVGGA
ncbi:hypothetical protein SKAU_G00289620 [Synaphobranchus kaupii]|uniref:Uncharacterized protein n=1 Tax=Synaphobranchus kaupii TaxID=118154 RepID=A0A9Q1ETF7_SYNKA|nr:hypothetical protein SKAU_G00289620 [Synaphobranchus kaupii]